MEINKIGENFEIKSTTDKYVISGNIIKTVQGDAMMTIHSFDLEENHLATISGDYMMSNNRIILNFNSTTVNYEDQIEIMKNVIETVKSILNV